MVAPRAGAWIETSTPFVNTLNSLEKVAPRAGAWIETFPSSLTTHPSLVAPRAGAWIETRWGRDWGGWTTSRPARARGLKPRCTLPYPPASRSRPARARGLKQSTTPYWMGWGVAPRAGAWIETFSLPTSHPSPSSRPARARGLKLQLCPLRTYPAIRVAPRAGAWIETSVRVIFRIIRDRVVAPRAGAWIETNYRRSYSAPGSYRSRPARARGLKLKKWFDRDPQGCRAPLARGLKH